VSDEEELKFRCIKCGRISTVGRCCGRDTREVTPAGTKPTTDEDEVRRIVDSAESYIHLLVEELLSKAECGLSTEVLADNVVKAAAWQGEVVAYKKILAAIDNGK